MAWRGPATTAGPLRHDVGIDEGAQVDDLAEARGAEQTEGGSSGVARRTDGCGHRARYPRRCERGPAPRRPSLERAVLNEAAVDVDGGRAGIEPPAPVRERGGAAAGIGGAHGDDPL